MCCIMVPRQQGFPPTPSLVLKIIETCWRTCVNCLYWCVRTTSCMLFILGKVVLASYLLKRGATAEWKNKCSYFNCLCKPSLMILLPANLHAMPYSPPLLNPFCIFSSSGKCKKGSSGFYWWLFIYVGLCSVIRLGNLKQLGNEKYHLSILCLIWKSSHYWFQGRNSHSKYMNC